jgi:phosphohistidine phosphatase
MELYIMRHGIAEEVSHSGRDRDRVLTEDGLERSRETGKALRKLGVKFDAIFASGFPRAWHTAEIVAAELDCRELLHELQELEADSSAGEALIELKRAGKGKASMLLVGHEPILSQLISLLLAGTTGLSISMKKGGLCKITCVRPDPGGCRLDWLVTSKQLCRMA